MVETWGDVLILSFQTLRMGIMSVLPRLLTAIVLFIIGWVIAVSLGRLVAQIIRALKVDTALESLGAKELLSRAGFKLNSGGLIGNLVKWFFIIVFLMAAADVLGLQEVTAFLRDIVLLYLPNVIVAAFILITAALLADVVQRVVRGSAHAAGVTAAGFLGGVARWSIWVFAILAALYQLGIAGPFVQTLFTGFIAMVSIAGGLAFGLGGKDAAGKFLEKLRADMAHKG